MSKTMKREIILRGKKYTMPKLDVDTYMDFLEVRGDIMNTENKNGLYTRAQFVKMMETIVKVYGDQFTVEDLKDKEGGLSVGGIVTEFSAIELGIMGEVDAQVKKIEENFTSGK